MSRSPRPGQRGASLIEVMVAVLVLSIGLLGMASLLGVSLRNTQSADFRSQAANLSYDIIDTARRYPNNTNQLVSNAWSNNACVVGAPAYQAVCGPNASAFTCDRARAFERVCQVLPNGRARMVQTAAAGVADRVQVRVDICWSDDRSRDPAQTADCSGAGETLFSVDAEI